MAKAPGLKEKRAASLLRELISEALGTLSDERLQGLTVTDVEVKRGMYDANVYLDESIFSEEEKKRSYVSSKKPLPFCKPTVSRQVGGSNVPSFTSSSTIN